MRIAIKASEEQKEWVHTKGFFKAAEILWLDENAILSHNVDALFLLQFDDAGDELTNYEAPIIFLNAVTKSCNELPPHCVRINAWPGFLNVNCLEIATGNELLKDRVEALLHALQWKFIWAPDVIGMITARIVCMIINEAYYGLEQGISTKEEIDIAMKLGTNYPYGPFEWCNKIGAAKVVQLLIELSASDERYAPATLLIQEAQNTKQ